MREGKLSSRGLVVSKAGVGRLGPSGHGRDGCVAAGTVGRVVSRTGASRQVRWGKVELGRAGQVRRGESC
jgi:hypothetical protein